MSISVTLGRRQLLFGFAGSLAAAGKKKTRITGKRDFLTYRNENGYSAWPTILQAKNGDLLIAFDEAMRRPKVTHSDPTYYAMVIRSSDGGKTWGSPSPIGGYGNIGVESIGAVVLRNGDIPGQCYHPRYWTEGDIKKKFPEKLRVAKRRPEFPWYQEHGNYNYIYRSTDHGYTWEDPVSFDASPYRMAFMLRSAAELADGTLVLPCTDDSFDSGRNFVVFSRDGGRTWDEVTPITRNPKIFFSEPALLLLPGGKLLAMMRTHEGGDYFLHQSESTDGGKTWTEARRTGMWGYPPHMLLLQNGNILCVYGRRKAPFGIRACLSYDQGATWDTDNELVLRDDFPNGNLGYPTSMQYGDSRMLTVYYGEDPTGVTCIHGSFYEIESV